MVVVITFFTLMFAILVSILLRFSLVLFILSLLFIIIVIIIHILPILHLRSFTLSICDISLSLICIMCCQFSTIVTLDAGEPIYYSCSLALSFLLFLLPLLLMLSLLMLLLRLFAFFLYYYWVGLSVLIIPLAILFF